MEQRGVTLLDVSRMIQYSNLKTDPSIMLKIALNLFIVSCEGYLNNDINIILSTTKVKWTFYNKCFIDMIRLKQSQVVEL